VSPVPAVLCREQRAWALLGSAERPLPHGLFDGARFEAAGVRSESSALGWMIRVELDSAEVPRWREMRRCSAYLLRFGHG
jgi:hypothetical protein